MLSFRYCVFLTCFLFAQALAAQETPIFLEEEGVVVFEAESAPRLGNWQEQTTIGGFTGENYLNYQGSNFFNDPGNSVLNFIVRITRIGTYRIQWRSRIAEGTSNTDNNDSWLRLPDASEFYALKGTSRLYPKGSGRTPNPAGAGGEGWFKVYQNVRNNWTWDTRTNDNDPYQIYAAFDSIGDYRFQIAGRSRNHAIDRVALYHSDVSSASALDLSRPTSTLLNPTSVSGLTAERVTISPNPVINELRVELPPTVSTEVQDLLIIDSTGRQFYQHPRLPTADGTLQLSTVDLPSGTYFLYFTAKGQLFLGKFVK